VHPDDRERVTATVAAALSANTARFDYECRIVRPDGEVRHVRNRVLVDSDERGHPIRTAGALVDVTEQRCAEEALAESERRHREMVENSSDLVAILDSAGIVQYTSPSVHRILGFHPHERVGHSTFELMHPDDVPRVREVMRSYASPGPALPVEFRLRHRDGRWRVLEALGQGGRDRAGQYSFIVNARDVTDRKLTEDRQRELMRELEAARLSAEDAARAKSQFLANMSHEIRTPMNAIVGLTELVLDTTLTAGPRRHLEMVRDSADVLLALINDILDLSKIEAAQLAIEAIPVDLIALTHSLTSLLAVGARAHGLELLLDVASDVPRRVFSDPTRLRQVLTNLVGNAIKFTSRGEVMVSVTLTGVEDGAARVRFAVRDTGIGIAAEKREVIFREFSQVDASTTRRYGGTGLGLAICRKLVTLMGGDLCVESELGRGSEFSFTLPLTFDTTVQATSTEKPLDLSGRRALIVDDNTSSRRLLRGMLEGCGATVGEAATAPAALAMLREGMRAAAPFALVVFDVGLPARSGWDLAVDIRTETAAAGVRLVALTTGQVGDAQRCADLTIDAAIDKPVARETLRATLASILSGRAVADPAPARPGIAAARRKLEILLAEDNPVNQEVARAMLRKRGHAVMVVGDGRQAVEAARDRRFDLVLMDIHMPEMDGFEATAAIRTLAGGASLPIVALTADALAGEREHCLAKGMTGYLSKPFKARELFAVVEGCVPENPIDLEGFRESMRAAGAVDSVDRILSLFLRDAPMREAQVEDALRRGHATEIHAAAHAFKSAAGAIRAGTLAATLQSIEEAAGAGRVEDARTAAAELRLQLDLLLTWLREQGARESNHA
jgi:two-component system sensor histidine kinase/response regulator